MVLKDDFRKNFVPDPAYFTFWMPQKKEYSKSKHQNRRVTNAEVELHLKGEKGLTISPFVDEENVKFGVIDIDVKDFDLVTMICEKLHRIGINPNVFESKQKGYHIYIFPEEPIPATQMRIAIEEVLSDDITIRGDKSVIDIFPAQKKTTEKGGNKINLPLFGDSRRQLAIDGQPMDRMNISITPLECFAQLLEESKRAEEHEEQESHPENNSSYPCINRILNGVENGVRGVLGFELGRYMISQGIPRKAVGMFLRDWNRKNNPPLEEYRVKEIIHSLKEERCNNAPNCQNPKIKPFCDAIKCSKAEIVIWEDPKIIRKQNGYYIELHAKNGGKQMKRATNFTFDIIKADSDLKTVDLVVHQKNIAENIHLLNPTWNKFLTECSLRGLACDKYGKVKLSVLIGAELSHDKSKIESTDVDEMNLEKIFAMVRKEIRIGNIPKVEEGIVLQEEDIISGWRDIGVLYLRTGEICVTYHDDPKLLAQIFRSNGIEQKGVRAPIVGRPSKKVWVIKWGEAEESDNGAEDSSNDHKE